MKKIILFLFTLVICFSVFCGLNVKATGISLTMSNVVGIRTAGTQQGLRFSCSASEDFDGSTEHGFYLAIGNFDKDTFTAAIESNATTIGEKPLVNKNTNGTDKDFAITVIFPEDASVNDLCTYITSIAYYKNGEDFVFSDINLTKNVADEARSIYNTTESPAAIISSVAEATRVKVTKSDSSVAYYDGINDVTFTDGDTVSLVRGTYSDNFTVNADNVTIEGNQTYALNHDDTYTAAYTDTVLSCVVTITGDDFDLSKVVFSKQIELDGANNAQIHNCVTTLTSDTNNYAIGTITNDSSNLTIRDVAIANTVNRFFYAYSATISGLTIDHCCLLDAVEVSKSKGTGLCDFARFGQSSSIDKSSGTITITNCYVRTFQNFIHDRKVNEVSYVIRDNYASTAGALFFRSNSGSAGTTSYEIIHNRFTGSDGSWSVMTFRTSSTSSLVVKYNIITGNTYGPSGVDGYAYYINNDDGSGTIEISNNYYDVDISSYVHNASGWNNSNYNSIDLLEEAYNTYLSN